MYFRDEGRYGTSPQEVARYKADTALALGATHFIESDLHIAALIAVRAPLLRVRWFNQEAQVAISIAAWEAKEACPAAEANRPETLAA